MSGVSKALKKVFTKKVVKTLIVAAAAYYMYGAATGAFTAPEAGAGLTLAETSTPMITLGDAGAGAIETLEVGSVAGGGLTEAATTTGLESVAGTSGVDLTLAGGQGAGQGIIAGAATPPETGGFLDAAGNWISENPIPATILGQGVMGAAQQYMANQEEDPQYGLMGFDPSGTYQGAGIIDSATPSAQPDATVGVDAAQRPTVAGTGIVNQQVAAQAVAPTGVRRPVPRNQLSKV